MVFEESLAHGFQRSTNVRTNGRRTASDNNSVSWAFGKKVNYNTQKEKTGILAKVLPGHIKPPKPSAAFPLPKRCNW